MGENSFLLDLIPIKNGAKMKMTELLPLVVYPDTCGMGETWHFCLSPQQYLPVSELQIRGDIDDNSKIIFLISQRKYTL